MTPVPVSSRQIKQLITAAKTRIAGQEIYYYNSTMGTRLLTCQTFARLGELPLEELRRHLLEIQEFCVQQNRWGNPEVDFILSDERFSRESLVAYDFSEMDQAELAAAHRQLESLFRNAAPAELRDDNLDEGWRSRIFAALIGERDEQVPEETLLGLSPEFFMQIEWLPGARFERGELLPDPCFHKQAPTLKESRTYDKNSLGFIFNFIREFGSLEYVNIGRVIGSLSRARESQGRQDVYIAVLKPPDSGREIVRII